MRRFHPVLFDLDGTLADTYAGIVQAAEEVLSLLRLPLPPRSEIEALTGKGVSALIEGLLARAAPGAAPGLLDEAERRYREAYGRTCVAGTRLYPGMLELVKKLPPPLALLTNKARPFTDQILEGVGLAPCFQVVVAGDDPGMRLKPDPWAIHEALRRLGLPKDRALLVGDTSSDVKAAAAAQLPCCVVAWGHGGPKAAEGAAHRVETVAALEALLLAEDVRSPGPP